MADRILRVANSLITFLIAAVLCLCILYAGYALWDNGRIYSAAEDVQMDMIRLKPTENIPEGPSFQELMEVNPDVRAWIFIDNTKIDYPVLQGNDNLSYINTDVYGNFSLAGSIFLDARNAPDFSDTYCLLYGHHMDNSGMFGDLDLFHEQTFFENNSKGTLLVPETRYDLEIFACLLVRSSEEKIFNTDLWQDDIKALLSFAEQNAMFVREETIEQLRETSMPQVLAMSTCSSEFTEARTILLAAMHPRMAAE